jgi:transketolase
MLPARENAAPHHVDHPAVRSYRPGAANETASAWRVAVEIRERPVTLVLTRQKAATLALTPKVPSSKRPSKIWPFLHLYCHLLTNIAMN